MKGKRRRELRRDEARRWQENGGHLVCLRCGKGTSSYPREVPADGWQQMNECMCCVPRYAKALED